MFSSAHLIVGARHFSVGMDLEATTAFLRLAILFERDRALVRTNAHAARC